MSQPNILFILTDTQMRNFCGGYPGAVSLPHMEALAARSMRFDRAYSSCPVCTPARGALWTGLPPQVCGAWCNDQSVSPIYPMLGSIFANAGYRVGYTGKWHLNGKENGRAAGGFPQDWWYDLRSYVDEIGPDRHRSLVRAVTAGLSPYQEAEVTPAMGERLRAHDGKAALQALEARDEEFHAYRCVDQAERFFASHREDPFCFVVSFDEPHGPFLTPPDYQGRYVREDFPKPASWQASLEGKPIRQQQQRDGFPLGAWSDFAEWRLQHLRCTAYLDDQIGRLLQSLEDHGLADNTIVVLTSDHGDMSGAHGLWSKGPMMYEQCAGIPLLIHAPGLPAGACQTTVSHLDLLPTLLELTGQAIQELYPGQSLVSCLHGRHDPERSAVVSWNRFGLHHDGWGEFYPIRCIVRGSYKLAINLFDVDEFYDLDNDPDELINNIDAPHLTAQRRSMHEELLHWMNRVRDPMRGPQWGDRPWPGAMGPRAYHHLDVPDTQPRLAGFPFWDNAHGL